MLSPRNGVGAIQAVGVAVHAWLAAVSLAESCKGMRWLLMLGLVPSSRRIFSSRLKLLSVQVLDRVTAAHEKLEFGESGRAFYDFFWAQYADWYIESAKTRLYSSDAAVSQTTRKVCPLVHSLQLGCRLKTSRASAGLAELRR